MTGAQKASLYWYFMAVVFTASLASGYYPARNAGAVLVLVFVCCGVGQILYVLGGRK